MEWVKALRSGVRSSQEGCALRAAPNSAQPQPATAPQTDSPLPLPLTPLARTPAAAAPRRWMAREKARLDRDISQAERAAAVDENARRQRLKDSIAAVDTFNKQQLAQKAERRAKEREEDVAFASEWSTRLVELKKEVSSGVGRNVRGTGGC